ncbi:hypothetical protein OJ253_2589 [Cryptosporidium canis]|uniref:ATPase AAA-type core domain-containing protein n=1 Tax=Cryptosporidium canis TaxID=195482 RepID=A0A9D5DF13_9CRYT|nr:hypothetical protein OJ253_2589 [Cryptosporidium canis]
MESQVVSCNLEIGEDLKDGISLVSSHLVGREGSQVFLMELVIESKKDSRFWLPFMTHQDNSPGKENTVYLHPGLGLINQQDKGYIRPERPGGSRDHQESPNPVNMVLSGPLFTPLSAQSSLFLLNYRGLLVEALKRQLLYYLRLGGVYGPLSEALEQAIMPFMINEEFYLFQILLAEEKAPQEGEDETPNENPNSDTLKAITNLLVVPNLYQLSPHPVAQTVPLHAFEVESYAVQGVRDVRSIIKRKSPDLSSSLDAVSTFYLDITHILHKYVVENRVSLEMLKSIRNNVIGKIQDVLEETARFNALGLRKKVSVYLFLYNYSTSFGNLPGQDSPAKLLVRSLSKLECLKKVVLLEFDGGGSQPETNNASVNKPLRSRFLQSLILANCPTPTDGAQKLHADQKQRKGAQCGEGVEEEALVSRYLKLKKELNEYVSIFLLDRNLDAFLELMYYHSLVRDDLESTEGGISGPSNSSMVSWVIKACFGISDKPTLLSVLGVLHRNFVVGDLLYSALTEGHETPMCDPGAREVSNQVVSSALAGGVDHKDEGVRSVIEQVDEQLLVYKMFENQYTKINQIMNQQFTPRILIYSRGSAGKSKLSLVKQELIRHIQKHYINYKFVHKHILNLISPYVGQSEENIRRLFSTSDPTILILEGIDSISSSFTSTSRPTGTDYAEEKTLENPTSDSEMVQLSPNKTNLPLSDPCNDILLRISRHRERNRTMFSQNVCLLHPEGYKDEGPSSSSSNESRTLLTTLLLCLDNVEKKNQNVIVIALSNKDILSLDESITRAGRLDIHIAV